MKLVAKTLSVLAVGLALVLAGCGDEDGSTTTGAGSGTTQPRGEEGNPGTTTTKQGRDEKQGGREEQSSPASRTVPSREPTGPAPTDSGSLPNEGSKTVAPGVPTAKGGDNSIQTFGVEAPSEDRVEAAGVLQGFLDARLAGDWTRACFYLAESMRAQLVQSSGQAQGCAAAMRDFTAGISSEALRNAADIRVLSMRVGEGQAFLIYRDGESTPTAMPMVEDGGAWKVAAVAGSALAL